MVSPSEGQPATAPIDLGLIAPQWPARQRHSLRRVQIANGGDLASSAADKLL